MLPVIPSKAHNERLRQLRSDMRCLTKKGIRFTRAHPTRQAIRSGKLTASSSAKEIHDIIHTTPILRGMASRKNSAPLLAEIQCYQREHYPETFAQSTKKRKSNSSSLQVNTSISSSSSNFLFHKNTNTSSSKSLGSYRVTNYKEKTENSRTIAYKMKKRRQFLERERKKAEIEKGPSIGSDRSFSSLWTIHAVLEATGSMMNTAKSDVTSMHNGNMNNGIRSGDSNIIYNYDNIPNEFLGLEKMLMLQKEMCKKECRTIQKVTRNEMDVSLLMLPAEFLFEHKFEHYAKDRSMENVMRVMKRLISNAKNQAFDRWIKFVIKDQKREQFARVNQFKKQKGTELMKDIGQRITMNKLFVGFSTWRTTVIRMRNSENYDSAVIIQKYWRGLMDRTSFTRKKYRMDKLNLYSLFIEWSERRWRINHAEEAAQYRKEHRASQVIAAALRTLLARRELQAKRLAMLQENMEQTMALRVQCAWRKKQGRFALYLKQRARKALEEERLFASCDIQRVGRGFIGRLKVKSMIKKQNDDNKARQFLKRMMNQKLYSRFVRWKQLAYRQASVKRMVKRSLGGKLMRLFVLWYDNVQHELQNKSDAQLKEEERLRELRRLKLEKEENDRKVKRALQKMFNRVLVSCFNSWLDLVIQRRKARQLARRVLGNVMEGRFVQWIEWLDNLKDERKRMGQLAWEAEQRRLKEIQLKEEAEEKERIRKLKWVVAKMNQKLLNACYCALSDYAMQMKGVKSMLIRILHGVKLRLCKTILLFPPFF
jgi:hypothetical protein